VKVISISGIIGWDVVPDKIREQLTQANGEDVRVEISSPGGFVFDGLEIFNLIRNYAGNITTHLMGMAASMASYIALAGKKVTAEDNAIYMIHNVSTVSVGDYRTLEEDAKVIESMSVLLAKAYAKKSGKDIAEIRKMMDNETYLFGNEMKDAGFIDEIIGTEKEKDRASAILNARASIENCVKTMQAQDRAKSDLQKAAACLQSYQPPVQSAVIPEKKTTGVKTMNELQNFLQANAEARAEYDKIITAKVEETNAAWKAKAVKIGGYMKGEYPDTLKSLAVKTLVGEMDISQLEGAVALIDAQAEADKAAKAKKEGKRNPETPAQGHDLPREDGVITSESELQAEIAAKKVKA
jgi:ATP-dependent protease ClpP protease subunit